MKVKHSKTCELKARKSLGQNFLVHKPTCETIVGFCDIEPDDTMVELGPGQGALTSILLKKAKKVVAIELDARFPERLQGIATDGNLEVIEQDMLDVSYTGLCAQIGSRLKLIGNLPYNISSQILFKLIDERDAIDSCVFMFQKEVADRIASSPCSKAYGILSVITQYAFDVTRLMNVPPTLFKPAPKVTSSVIKLIPKMPEEYARDFGLFKSLVRTAFGKRRKKIYNALEGFLGFSDETLKQAIDQAGIDPSVRAEDVFISQYVSLANCMLDVSANRF